ncbi:Peptidase M [Parasponia andersonii]|uniref:Peptidase M n=1 Tax=Parasponia andersonii TaxID=3476 RepID=A0A2P5DPL3_PARAD|nr:Peptidase M [Parasponia andersonii]
MAAPPYFRGVLHHLLLNLSAISLLNSSRRRPILRHSQPLILLKWPGSDPNLPSVLLNSHTDVVLAEDDKWVYPPFAAHVYSRGHVYARGSQDMKCMSMQ